LTSDSDDEFEAALPEGYNMMNNSLLQVYNSQSIPSESPFHDSSGLAESENDHLSNSEASGADLRGKNMLQTVADVVDLAVPKDERITGHSLEKTSQLVEEREVSDLRRLGDAAVMDPAPAVTGVTLDVQEPATPQDLSAMLQTREGISSSLPYPGKSELLFQKLSQQTPQVPKRVTFAPEVAKHPDSGSRKRGKVEKHVVSHGFPQCLHKHGWSNGPFSVSRILLMY